MQDHDSLLLAVAGLAGFILVLMRWMFAELKKESKLRNDLSERLVALERRVIGQAAEITRTRNAYQKLKEACSRLWARYTEVQTQLNQKNEELIKLALMKDE